MTVKDSIKETAEKAGDRAAEGYRAARLRASEAYDSAAAKTGEWYGEAREGLSSAGRRTGDFIKDNPLTALVGGLAIGGVLGALLPGTRRERDLIGPYGRDLNSRARDAASAAGRVGRERLDELGFLKDEARETGERLLDKSKATAKEAGSAAAKAARGEG